MSTTKLTYTGHLSPVNLRHIPGIDPERQVIETGDVVDVPSDLVGAEPHWRRTTEDETQATRPHLEFREHAGHLEVRDLGEGLLSQVGNWEKTGAAESKTDNHESKDD